MYGNIYADALGDDPKKPKFQFWRPAMTKWFLKMKHLQSQTTQTYLYCLTKLRNMNLDQIIE